MPKYVLLLCMPIYGCVFSINYVAYSARSYVVTRKHAYSLCMAVSVNLLRQSLNPGTDNVSTWTDLINSLYATPSKHSVRYYVFIKCRSYEQIKEA